MIKKFDLLINIIIFSSLITTPSYSYANDPELNPGTVSNIEINEASGIAISRINEDVLWVINDSGNSSIFAMNSNGNHLATFNIQDVMNNDWEDLTSFTYKGKPYILIADVGDNKAKREKCYLHFIQEPDLIKTSNSSPVSIKPSWSIAFTYEDGPRDCESVAVDIVNEKILLLSKRDQPPVLYEIPLNKQKNIVAKKLGKIKPLPQPTQNDIRLIKYLNQITHQPTAMDISSDGLSAVILTYVNAYYFTSEEPTDWLTVFLSTPNKITLPPLQQAESVCFDKDGKSIYVTSEKIPAPLLKIDLTELLNM